MEVYVHTCFRSVLMPSFACKISLSQAEETVMCIFLVNRVGMSSKLDIALLHLVGQLFTKPLIKWFVRSELFAGDV